MNPALEVRHAVRAHATGGVTLVACSGGPDSLALALAARAELSDVGAVVVDHGLQSGSADVSATVAAVLAGAGLNPVEVRRVEVTDDGNGPEAAARTARYAALREAATAARATAVLLGHTRDDQAETVLLGLARGSGARSLAGMREVDGMWRRPLLAVARDTVHAALPYLAEGLDLRGLPYLDEHNSDDHFARVRVRRHLLPAFEEHLGPGVGAALARTADLLRADADALDEWAMRVYAEVVVVDATPVVVRVSDVEGLPDAVRTRVLRRAAVDAGARPGSLTRDHVLSVDRLVTAWRGQGAVALPGPVSAQRHAGRIEFATP